MSKGLKKVTDLLGMVLISMALCKMGYGLNSEIWWFCILGTICVTAGR